MKAKTGTTAGNYAFKAGPIWDPKDAAEKCPKVCGNHGGWDVGSGTPWTTTVPGEMSVCGCRDQNEYGPPIR